MALIAKYVARHRLREPRLLDTIANFLLKRGDQLDSKVSVLPSLQGMPGAGSGAALVLGGTVSLLCYWAGASHWGLTRMCPDPYGLPALGRPGPDLSFIPTPFPPACR